MKTYEVNPDLDVNYERTDEEMFLAFWRYAKIRNPLLRVQFLNWWKLLTAWEGEE
jgi:hypothetical protein